MWLEVLSIVYPLIGAITALFLKFGNSFFLIFVAQVYVFFAVENHLQLLTVLLHPVHNPPFPILKILGLLRGRFSSFSKICFSIFK